MLQLPREPVLGAVPERAVKESVPAGPVMIAARAVGGPRKMESSSKFPYWGMARECASKASHQSMIAPRSPEHRVPLANVSDLLAGRGWEDEVLGVEIRRVFRHFAPGT